MSGSTTSSRSSANDASYSAALGALLGAAVGDSCGSYLEFYHSIVTPRLVDKALTMPGGGVWRIASGQITDDTELALSLAHGLLEAATPIPLDSTRVKYGGLPANSIARWYSKWIASQLFDCGQTCRTSLGEAQHFTAADDAKELPAMAVMSTAGRMSMESKANGALMRLTPLPICYHRCIDEQIARLAAVDAQMSHPNPTCQLANALYAIAVASFIRRPRDSRAALQRVTAHMQHVRSMPSTDVAAVNEVQSWLTAAEEAASGSGELEEAEQQAGFVKHAFSLSFYHLIKGSTYEAAMRHTLLAGGDTDTNAAIVGGLVGAALGADAIPAHMTKAVLQCKPLRNRPQWLFGSHIPQLVEGLYNKLA